MLNNPKILLIFLETEDFGANDAFKIGFVSRISKNNDGDLTAVANDICGRISHNSPIAVAVTKASLNYSRDHTVAEGLGHVALQNSSALMSEDLVKSFAISGGAAADVEFEPMRSHSRL